MKFILYSFICLLFSLNGIRADDIDTKCGGILNLDDGDEVLETPEFTATTCTWLLYTTSPHISCTLDSLAMVAPCSDNFLEIRDGFNDNDTLIDSLCGTDTASAPYVSSGGLMFIRYESTILEDFTGPASLFQLTCTTTDSSMDPVCSETVEVSETIEITNPPCNTKSCNWLINLSSDVDSTYALECFVQYSYNYGHCSTDYLMIYDGTDSSSGTEMGKFCQPHHKKSAHFVSSTGSFYLSYATAIYGPYFNVICYPKNPDADVVTVGTTDAYDGIF